MLFAFIDESYTKDRYYVSAVLTGADDMIDLSRRVGETAEFASAFGVALGTEFHAHRLMTGRDGWEPVRGKPRAAIAIYRHMLTGLAGLPVSVYVEGVDIPKLNARYRYPDPPHLIVLRHVLEDLQAAAAMRGEHVIVICDEVNDQDAHSKKFGEYQQIGTPGYRSTTLSRIEQIMFADSRQSPGLQMADAIAYLFRRMDAHTTASAPATRAVEQLWETVRPRVKKARRWDP